MFRANNIVPPSVRALFFRSKDKKPEPTEVNITDDDILALIDEVYLQARDLLNAGQYYYAVKTYIFLSEYDVCYKKLITGQLSNVKFGSEFIGSVELSEDIMSYLVMIQSYYNSFRINLLSDIINNLNNRYNEVLDSLKTDFNEALSKFNRTNSAMMLIISTIKGWKHQYKDDFIVEQMYDETHQSFLNLKIHAAKRLQQLISDYVRTL